MASDQQTRHKPLCHRRRLVRRLLHPQELDHHDKSMGNPLQRRRLPQSNKGTFSPAQTLPFQTPPIHFPSLTSHHLFPSSLWIPCPSANTRKVRSLPLHPRRSH